MSDKPKIVPYIRYMIRRDMPEVLGIELASFPNPWSEEDFVRILRNRNVIGMVSEFKERVVGYMLCELSASRIDILNFAVHAAMQRRGIGTAMASNLYGKLSPQRRSRIVLNIRETNLDAQMFFRAVGFQCVSTLRNFYDDTPEDAYVFERRYIEQRTHGSRSAASIASH